MKSPKTATRRKSKAQLQELSKHEFQEALLKTRATVLQGDARQAMKALPDRSVQCVITSPPYWGTRDYEMKDQIGMEADLQSYLDELLTVFEEVWRVTKEDGLMWVNIGDVFASGNRTYRAPDSKYRQRALRTRPRTPSGLKPKDLIGIPWRLAFALQEKGWYLRTEIVWHKTNAMPESVKDRPTRCHEYLFLFSKSERYRFSRHALEKGHAYAQRSVWSIANGKSKLNGHHSVFPMQLVTPCIHAATRKDDLVLDPFCGTGTVGQACAQFSRRFLGIELNSRYVRAAVKRIGVDASSIKFSRGKEPNSAKAVGKPSPHRKK